MRDLWIWQHCYDDVAELLGVPEGFEIMALIPLDIALWTRQRY